MKVHYVDAHSVVGGFNVEAENENEEAILSVFMRAIEQGWIPHIHSSRYADGNTKSVLFGLIAPREPDART